jgi:hypothetical protein
VFIWSHNTQGYIDSMSAHRFSSFISFELLDHLIWYFRALFLRTAFHLNRLYRETSYCLSFAGEGSFRSENVPEFLKVSESPLLDEIFVFEDEAPFSGSWIKQSRDYSHSGRVLCLNLRENGILWPTDLTEYLWDYVVSPSFADQVRSQTSLQSSWVYLHRWRMHRWWKIRPVFRILDWFSKPVWTDWVWIGLKGMTPWIGLITSPGSSSNGLQSGA